MLLGSTSAKAAHRNVDEIGTRGKFHQKVFEQLLQVQNTKAQKTKQIVSIFV